ncbi:hypothetical protein MNEG_7645 [Monoraphidium neglectum]|uniref:Protein kinase domain-containing protein n=1 Tax=Monoraphidium neglectum TaxID=145388 RepID=A0A0D2KYM6_9CHLO|nr:hypothetical protein MNEG_7645 [Monoraphidium neglectum]KIZ00314.1 hypothetical protein MNEG_7645 [Monoraphidium neglectum]|eukprot:XP_013899333.1 hypothetical protein MNEG_7645 [Monoraphidium neglectum]
MGPEVGRGSYGTVHVATHRDSGRAYAVKVLRKCPGGSPPDTSAAVTPGATTGGGLSGDAGAGTPSLTAGGDEDEGCCAEPDGANLEAIEREVHAWTTVQTRVAALAATSVQGSQFVARLHGLYEDETNAYLVQPSSRLRSARSGGTALARGEVQRVQHP